MQYTLLGSIAAWADDRPVPVRRPRQLAILGFLLLNHDILVSTDRIVDALWEHDGPSTAHNQVQSDVSILRRLFRSGGVPDPITTRPTGYLFGLGDGVLDLDSFSRSVARARATDDATAAVPHVRSALALWQGTPLGGIKAAYAPAHRLALEERRLETYEYLFDLELGLGRHAGITTEILGLVEQNPTRERLVMQLMLALHRGGRAAEALHQARAFRSTLIDQHGLDPGKVLQQLEQAILRDDPSLAAPAAPPAGGAVARRVPRLLPRDVYGFVERPEQTSQLDEILATRDDLAVAVLTGMAGIGKTTLAVHWSHESAGRFPDGQLYLNLRGFDVDPVMVRPADAVRALLVALGETAKTLPDDLDHLVNLYRTRTAEKRLLVVLDNARTSVQVLPLLPACARCAVLITSRNRLAGLVSAVGAQVVDVDVFTDAAALDFLRHRLGAGRVDREPTAATEIAARCGLLPLALAVVAASASGRPTVELAMIARELKDRSDGLDQFRIADEPGDLDTVFAWSYDQLSPAAAGLFRAIGEHPVAVLSKACATSLTGAGPSRARRLLGELVQASLITEVSQDRFASHDLLRAYAQTKARSDTETCTARRRMADHYLQSALIAALRFQPGRAPLEVIAPLDGVVIAPIADRLQALAWLAADYDALVALVAAASGWGLDDHVWQLAWCLSDYMFNRGRWRDWIRTQRNAVSAARRRADRKAVALSQRGLARALMQMERFDEAEAQLTEAMHACAEMADQRGRRLTLQILADMRGKQGRHDEALDHFETALTLYEAAGDELGRAAALNNIGTQSSILGWHAKAIDTSQQALAIFAERGAINGMCAVHDTLGGAYHRAGDIPTAIRQYQRALTLAEEVGNVNLAAMTAVRLGRIYRELGDHATAKLVDKLADKWVAQLDA